MRSGVGMVAPIVLFTLGGLWIFLTGGCCEAVFKGMPQDQKAAIELLLTLPGCVLCLAGMALLTARKVAGAIILAYALLLAFAWTSQMLKQHLAGPKDGLMLLVIFNTPSLAIAVWAAVLLLSRAPPLPTVEPDEPQR